MSAIGNIEGTAEIWDTAKGRKVQTFKVRSGSVRAIALNPGRHAPGHRGRRRHGETVGHHRARGCRRNLQARVRVVLGDAFPEPRRSKPLHDPDCGRTEERRHVGHGDRPDARRAHAETVCPIDTIISIGAALVARPSGIDTLVAVFRSAHYCGPSDVLRPNGPQ
jgi:hypothetical protein